MQKLLIGYTYLHILLDVIYTPWITLTGVGAII